MTRWTETPHEGLARVLLLVSVAMLAVTAFLMVLAGKAL